VNDARDIATALKQLGFSVIFLEDAERGAMLKAIADLGNKLSRGSVGLFYYAGHGLQVKGENYLVPIDAPLDSDTLEYNMVPVQSVIDRMEEAKNGVNLLILDACRDNPFVSKTRSGQRGLAGMEAPIGTLVAFAASRNQTASDGDGPNGLYTKYLLKNMRIPGLAVELMFKNVLKDVSAETGGKQVPEVWTKLQGDFFFLPLSQPSPPALPSPTPQVTAPQPATAGNDDAKELTDPPTPAAPPSPISSPADEVPPTPPLLERLYDMRKELMEQKKDFQKYKEEDIQKDFLRKYGS
jgi:uncharacterized caspase-like protein